MSTIFFILEYAPLAAPKALYLSMESILIPILRYIKISFSACTLTDITTVHCSSWGCTSVLVPQNPVLSIAQVEHPQTAFPIGTFPNFNCLDDEDFNHLSERTLCVMPHIGCQFMSQKFNVCAQGIMIYK